MHDPGPLVDAAWLRAHLEDVVVVDCQYVVGRPTAGREAYLAGHLPGAGFLSVERDLSGSAGGGRNPLPTAEEFVAAARRAGIRRDRPVVAYDQAMVGGAARLWWLLRSIGKDDVAVLDGGLEAWDGPLASGDEDVGVGNIVAAAGSGTVVSAEEVMAGLGSEGRILIDTRPSPRYRGEHEPVDAVAGHIPGALNLPNGQPLSKDMVTTNDDIVVYCGSGVSACVLLLQLAVAGRSDAQLYAGSWSEWSALGLPVATGEEEGTAGLQQPS